MLNTPPNQKPPVSRSVFSVFNAPTFRVLAFGAAFAVVLAIGLAALRYALPHIPAPSPLPNLTLQRKVLIFHAVSASVALLTGPWQFLMSLLRKRRRLHRWVGRVYMVAVACAGFSALPLALRALGGIISTLGFMGLGILWMVSSGAGLAAILQGRVSAHQDWMTRSYAMTAAAITLRLYMVPVIVLHLPFVEAYRAISWLAWAPNLIVAERIIWLRRHAH